MIRARPRPVLILLAVGVVALILCLLRLPWAPEAFFRSYLPACLFWIGIPAGALALLMIHGLTGGAWGFFLRPVLAASAGVLPLNVLLFIPLAFGLAQLFPWAGPGWHPEGITGGQAVWLRPGVFLIREAVVLALWLSLAAALEIWGGRSAALWNPFPLGRAQRGGRSRRVRGSKRDFTRLNLSLSGYATDVEGRKSHLDHPHPNPVLPGSPARPPPGALRATKSAPGGFVPEGEGVQYGIPFDSLTISGRTSALGLIVYGLTVTMFGIDWIMSLEPRWSSTNIGFLAAVDSMLAALAFGTTVLCVLARDGRSPQELAAPRFGDLGGLLLAFVLLWSYLAFQQYLTIWSENLPDKAIWYVQRNHGGWRGWSWVLAAVAGALPFFLLLSHDLKRDPRRLIWAAGLVLAGRLLDVYWQVLPGFYPTPGGLSVLDVLPFIGIGGVWLAAFSWMLPRYLIRYDREKPPHDPGQKA